MIASLVLSVVCHYGCAYYPEAWPEDRWETDLKFMREAGIDMVRMGEFNWSNFEPKEGTFDFAPYLRMLALCEKYGIRVMMCTPEAAMPRWMHAKYPETLKLREDGTRAENAVRHSSCPTSAKYRAFANRVVERMAEAFKNCPAIECWQIENELMVFSSTRQCFCGECAKGFQKSLKLRYGTLERLNGAQNGVFHSAKFTDWDEIVPPFRGRRSWDREYVRYQADCIRDDTLARAAILKRANPKWRITTNNPCCTGRLRFDEIFGGLDFAATDTYITMGAVDRARWQWSMFRGLCGRPQPFMMAETGCFSSASDSPRTFEAIKAWFWDAKLHGCSDHLFFRWRESVNGEEDHPAILPWSGVPGVGYMTVKRVKEEFDRSGFAFELPRSGVAIIHDAQTDQYNSVRGEPANMFFETEIFLHDAVERFGLIPDMVQLSDSMDFSSYRIIFLPDCEMVSVAQQERLRVFVRNGGTLVALPRTNCTDPLGGGYYASAYPVGMTDLFGYSVNERRRLTKENPGEYWRGRFDSVELEFPDGDAFAGRLTVERMEVFGAEVLAKLSSTCFAGSPLLTRMAYGKGEVLGLAVFPDRAGAKTLVKWCLGRIGFDTSVEWPASVVVAKRGGRLVIVNCADASVLTPKGRLNPFEVRFADAATGAETAEVRIIRENRGMD